MIRSIILCVCFVVLAQCKVNYKKPKVPTKQANPRFLKCCKDNLPKQCWDACYYDVKLLPTAKRVFVDGDKKNNIPVCDVVTNWIDYLKCANGGMDAEQDNRQCCKDTGIQAVCSPFCNPSKPFQLKQEQKNCGYKLREILTCHQYGLEPEDK